MKSNIFFKSIALVVASQVASLFGFCQQTKGNDITINTVVKRASENFSRNYVKNYVAIAECTMNVKSGEKYIQTMGQVALSAMLDFNQKTGDLVFDEWNAIRYNVLEQYVTDLVIPGSYLHLKQRRNINQDLNGIDQYYVNYVDDFDPYIFSRQEALHKYSPLNSKMIDNYAYELESKQNNGYVIKFRTVKGFPKPMRIHAEGRLYIDLNHTVTAIEVTDMEDRYSSYMYSNAKGTFPKVCEYSYRVEYKKEGSGLVTSLISENVHWIEPGNKKAEIYFQPCHAPYKQPFKYDISTSTTVVFTQHVTGLSENDCKELKKCFIEGNMAPRLIYLSSVNTAYWRKKWAKRNGMQQILKDLSASFDEFDKQAVENSNRINEEIIALDRENAKACGFSFDKYISVTKKMQSIGMEVYRQLYGKDFYNR